MERNANDTFGSGETGSSGSANSPSSFGSGSTATTEPVSPLPKVSFALRSISVSAV